MWQLLGSSSMVHCYSTPVSIPDYTLDITFSQTLSNMALYHSTSWWFASLACTTKAVGLFHHLIYSMQNYYITDVLLLGTL